CSRSIYALAERGQGPNPKLFGHLDPQTNMPTNASIFSLLITAAWILYFFASNLAGMWTGPFVFDPSELCIISVYMMYIPIFIQWMRKEKDESTLRRFVLPVLAIAGSIFMMVACVLGHGMACVWFAIFFVAVMALGMRWYK
ncbi:MAG: APC family permease, partial [Clostridia bacterium]|nr:APC family permease [Clostridia bacterium]